jgi:hypothetical protein
MTVKEIELLKWFADGHYFLTEYDDEETWSAAFALRKAGLIEGRSLLTGTAGFTLTEAGRVELVQSIWVKL